MTGSVSAETLKEWLADGAEIALFDVREPGQFGEGHLFFAVPLPYSGFELRLPLLAPNPGVRMVLCDDGDGVAERAARRADALGYTSVHVLSGGTAAWRRAGYTLFAGVNVPSKTFGELVELERDTPHLTADELQSMREAGEDLVIVDGRPFGEFQRVSIPGGICCPNGELALRIDEIAGDPATTIVVNCAGRTRSIIGAQTLIDLGVPNPVYALENGTQGWALAGLELDHGADRRYPSRAAPRDPDARRSQARRLAEQRKVEFVSAADVTCWLSESDRTTYLFDVRTEEEFAADGMSGFTHAPGGQLVQATDMWIGVRGARIVLADSELIRAPIIAAWLRQLGHDASVLDGGVASAAGRFEPSIRTLRPAGRLATISAADLEPLIKSGGVRLVDLRSSADYREAHIEGAIWSVRPRLAAAVNDPALPIVLTAEDPAVAELAAIDLDEIGVRDVKLLTGGVSDWQAGGLPLAATPQSPPDSDRIDFLFFTHRRLLGDAEASRQYLAWETALIGQLDDQERRSFNIVPPRQS